MDWYQLISGAIQGAICIWIGMWLGAREEEKKHHMEYSWFCPAEGCITRFESNSPEWTLKLADEHERYFH